LVEVQRAKLAANNPIVCAVHDRLRYSASKPR